MQLTQHTGGRYAQADLTNKRVVLVALYGGSLASKPEVTAEVSAGVGSTGYRVSQP